MIWAWIIALVVGLPLLAVGVRITLRGDLADSSLRLGPDKELRSNSLGLMMIGFSLIWMFVIPFFFSRGAKGERASQSYSPPSAVPTTRALGVSDPANASSETASASTAARGLSAPEPSNEMGTPVGRVGPSSTSGATPSITVKSSPTTSADFATLSARGPWTASNGGVDVVIERCAVAKPKSERYACVVRVENHSGRGLTWDDETPLLVIDEANQSYLPGKLSTLRMEPYLEIAEGGTSRGEVLFEAKALQAGRPLKWRFSFTEPFKVFVVEVETIHQG